MNVSFKSMRRSWMQERAEMLLHVQAVAEHRLRAKSRWVEQAKV